MTRLRTLVAVAAAFFSLALLGGIGVSGADADNGHADDDAMLRLQQIGQQLGDHIGGT